MGLAGMGDEAQVVAVGPPLHQCGPDDHIGPRPEPGADIQLLELRGEPWPWRARGIPDTRLSPTTSSSFSGRAGTPSGKCPSQSSPRQTRKRPLRQGPICSLPQSSSTPTKGVGGGRGCAGVSVGAGDGSGGSARVGEHAMAASTWPSARMALNLFCFINVSWKCCGWPPGRLPMPVSSRRRGHGTALSFLWGSGQGAGRRRSAHAYSCEEDARQRNSSAPPLQPSPSTWLLSRLYAGGDVGLAGVAARPGGHGGGSHPRRCAGLAAAERMRYSNSSVTSSGGLGGSAGAGLSGGHGGRSAPSHPRLPATHGGASSSGPPAAPRVHPSRWPGSGQGPLRPHTCQLVGVHARALVLPKAAASAPQ